jgi:hypothetical protein
LMSFETERCLYVEPSCIWLCIRAPHSERVVVFHSIPAGTELAESLLASLPVLNPDGEGLPESRIERIWNP